MDYSGGAAEEEATSSRKRPLGGASGGGGKRGGGAAAAAPPEKGSYVMHPLAHTAWSLRLPTAAVKQLKGANTPQKVAALLGLWGQPVAVGLAAAIGATLLQDTGVQVVHVIVQPNAAVTPAGAPPSRLSPLVKHALLTMDGSTGGALAAVGASGAVEFTAKFAARTVKMVFWPEAVTRARALACGKAQERPDYETEEDAVAAAAAEADTLLFSPFLVQALCEKGAAALCIDDLGSTVTTLVALGDGAKMAVAKLDPRCIPKVQLVMLTAGAWLGGVALNTLSPEASSQAMDACLVRFFPTAERILASNATDEGLCHVYTRWLPSDASLRLGMALAMTVDARATGFERLWGKGVLKNKGEVECVGGISRYGGISTRELGVRQAEEDAASNKVGLLRSLPLRLKDEWEKQKRSGPPPTWVSKVVVDSEQLVEVAREGLTDIFTALHHAEGWVVRKLRCMAGQGGANCLVPGVAQKWGGMVWQLRAIFELILQAQPGSAVHGFRESPAGIAALERIKGMLAVDAAAENCGILALIAAKHPDSITMGQLESSMCAFAGAWAAAAEGEAVGGRAGRRRRRRGWGAGFLGREVGHYD